MLLLLLLLPDIGLGRKDAIEERFRGHPLDGQHRPATLAIVVRPESSQQRNYHSYCSNNNTLLQQQLGLCVRMSGHSSGLIHYQSK